MSFPCSILLTTSIPSAVEEGSRQPLCQNLRVLANSSGSPGGRRKHLAENIELILMHRIHEDNPGDFAGVAVCEQPHQETTERLPHQDERTSESDPPKELP